MCRCHPGQPGDPRRNSPPAPRTGSCCGSPPPCTTGQSFVWCPASCAGPADPCFLYSKCLLHLQIFDRRRPNPLGRLVFWEIRRHRPNFRREQTPVKSPAGKPRKPLKRSALRADVTCRASLVTPAFILLALKSGLCTALRPAPAWPLLITAWYIFPFPAPAYPAHSGAHGGQHRVSGSGRCTVATLPTGGQQTGLQRETRALARESPNAGSQIRSYGWCWSGGSRGRRGTQNCPRMAVSVCLLPLSDTSAFCIQLQLVELPLVELAYRRLRRQDRVEVVTRPLHPALVEVAAGLHSDETHLQKRVDTFHCGVLCQPCHSSDGVIAGMAGVRLAILDQQQIGVHHECGWREFQ